MTKPWLTVHNLRTALSNGNIFVFNNDFSALRAWAVQMYSSDLEIKALMDQKPVLLNSTTFSHWVDILTKVNLFLDEPIVPKHTKESATLRDYFLLEEVLISKYIQQVGARTRFTGLHGMAASDGERLNYPAVSASTSYFLQAMPHYVKPDSDLARFLNQSATTDPNEWAKQASIERTKPDSLLMLFLKPTVVMLGVTTWLWSLSSKSLSQLREQPDFWLLNLVAILFTLLFFISGIASQNQTLEDNMPNIYKEMSDCVLEHFESYFSNWYAILQPTSFEGRFLLRAYFNMMHSINLNSPSAVSEFDMALRLLIPPFNASVLFSMAILYFHNTQGRLIVGAGSHPYIRTGTVLPVTPEGSAFPIGDRYRPNPVKIRPIEPYETTAE